jgi:hypothetical protein
MNNYEKKREEEKMRQMMISAIKERAITEWPDMTSFNSALRQLEVFAQLMKLPQFVEWMKKNIIIRDEVDHDQKCINTYVIFTDGRDIDDDGNPVEKDPEEHVPNIVQCPGCGVAFDANVETSRIILADKVPDA